ncbi:hypothetical protein KQX54_002086 [Cotesia glomerata]|uniref:Uncharacterized protein n=1 Tax=Cotesia glomerata TaxID=32391 RepID=A0AAV7I086_COTGL|nr:hypothetical protein KQX54_002086 [Cotesia glomerata]
MRMRKGKEQNKNLVVGIRMRMRIRIRIRIRMRMRMKMRAREKRGLVAGRVGSSKVGGPRSAGCMTLPEGPFLPCGPGLRASDQSTLVLYTYTVQPYVSLPWIGAPALILSSTYQQAPSTSTLPCSRQDAPEISPL